MVLAVALAVVFYALALLVVAALIAAAVVAWKLTTYVFYTALFTFLFGVMALSLVIAMLPRRERFVAPGLLVDPGAEPALSELVTGVARAIDVPPPDELYLGYDTEAGAGVHGGPGRRRRYVLLGLPLLEVLTVDQLRALVAHELAHHAGGDTGLSPWIGRTRAAALRSVAAFQMEEFDDDDLEIAPKLYAMARWPFELYARTFLRITGALARRAEFTADAASARVAGRDAAAGMLRMVVASDAVVDRFLAHDVETALRVGRRPPIGDGLRRALGTDRVQQIVRASLEQRLEQAEHDPYDSHPTLRQRLEAFGTGPDDEPPATGPIASSLLVDREQVEIGLLVALFGEGARGLEPATWEELEPIWLEGAAGLTSRNASLLEGRTVRDAPRMARDFGNVAIALRRENPDIGSEDEVKARVRTVLPAALAVALVDAGFTYTAPPGEPPACVRGDERFEPWEDLWLISERTADRDAYIERLERAGVADAPLGVVEVAS